MRERAEQVHGASESRRRLAPARDRSHGPGTRGTYRRPAAYDTSPPRIRVLCVDDHRIVREGVALIIAREPDMEVVGPAATGDAVVIFKRERPDVT